MSLYRPELSLPYNLRKTKFRHKFLPNKPKYNDLLKRYFWELDRKKRDWEAWYQSQKWLGYYKALAEQRGIRFIKELKLHRETKAQHKREIAQVIRDCEKRIAKVEAEKQTLINFTEKARRSREQHKNRVKQERRIKLQTRKLYDELRAKVSDIDKANLFYSRKFDWKEAEPTKVELMVRAMISMTPLFEKKTITYQEVQYLAVGYQKEFFGRDDLESRFGAGSSKYWRRDITNLVSVDYIKKIPGKDYYYLTPAGTKRLRDIVRFVFCNSYETYFKQPTQ